MSGDNHDRFDDILMRETGIFAEGSGSLGDGLSDFDTAKTIPSQEGVEVEMRCRHCGKPCRLCMEWGEMIAVAHDVAPQMAYGPQIGSVIKSPVPWAWSRVNQMWWPQLSCSQCQSPCGPMFSADEAKRHVQVAMQRRWIDPARVKPLMDASARAAQMQPMR